MSRVLVCGGRDYDDQEHVFRCLDALHGERPFARLFHGGAAGADRLADRWAASRQVCTVVFRANWQKYGPAAGPRRNQKMLELGQPTLVVAFPGGRGTEDMVRRARSAGVNVFFPGGRAA